MNTCRSLCYCVSLLALVVACSAEVRGASDSTQALDGGTSPDASTGPRDGMQVSEDDAGVDASAQGLEGTLAIDDVAIFQTVRKSLVLAGSEDVPVIANKRALLRAYVSATRAVKSRALVATFTLSSSAGDLTFASDAAATTLGDTATRGLAEVGVPASALTADTTISVVYTDKLTGETLATWPASGEPYALEATNAQGPLEIVLVPIQYSGDGSGRLPSTSATTLAEYKAGLLALYPTSDVRLTVRTPLAFSRVVAPNGTGWSELLSAISNQRAADRPSSRVYYMGLIDPAASKSTYCSRGCVAGLSALVTQPQFASARASVVLGYGGEDGTSSLAHELGHAHGRQHAPCEVADADARYPHAGGRIGVWGFDNRDNSLRAPASFTDFMGYCDPTWISDYTYTALHKRLLALQAAPATAPKELVAVASLVLHPDGTFERTGHAKIAGPELQSTLQPLSTNGNVGPRIRAAIHALSHSGDTLVYAANLPELATKLRAQ